MKQNVMLDSKSIGQKIREEREKLGLSREELAEIIGLSEYYVGQLERGERQMSLPVCVRLAGCLHVSLDYLIFGRTDTAPQACMHDAQTVYDAADTIADKEIMLLLNKCSPHELELFKKLLRTILPYVGKHLS